MFGIGARVCLSLSLAMVAVCGARADEPSSIGPLRAKFPHGIPWHVEFSDSAGKSLGAIDMLITAENGSSCLGGMNPDGLRVEFVRKDNLSPSLSTTSYGVAKFTGDKIRIDLTGGLCDAYRVMDGQVAADGSSTGNVVGFGMRYSKDLATYRASIR